MKWILGRRKLNQTANCSFPQLNSWPVTQPTQVGQGPQFLNNGFGTIQKPYLSTKHYITSLLNQFFIVTREVHNRYDKCNVQWTTIYPQYSYLSLLASPAKQTCLWEGHNGSETWVRKQVEVNLSMEAREQKLQEIVRQWEHLTSICLKCYNA